MKSNTESLEEFYQKKFNYLPDNLQQELGHFNVFRLEDCVGNGKTPIQYSRRDFYKIMLVRGNNIYHYADKSVKTEGSTLMFFNPQIPYTFQSQDTSEGMSGYFCIFKEFFFTEKMRGGISDLPMFEPGNKPSYALTAGQYEHVSAVFQKMRAEIDSDYRFKYDLIRNYVTELIHYALKMEPTETLYQHTDANARITAVFAELLERQFPIESPSQRFTMRSAQDFAEKLSVHVNHLNRALKATTGKTTSHHISERITNEAKALLKHSNWNISEISYCLGFEEPAHFNNFFKKQTEITPTTFRSI
jgi:AraC family transcriptional activator of pobA